MVEVQCNTSMFPKHTEHAQQLLSAMENENEKKKKKRDLNQHQNQLKQSRFGTKQLQPTHFLYVQYAMVYDVHSIDKFTSQSKQIFLKKKKTKNCRKKTRKEERLTDNANRNASFSEYINGVPHN